MNISVVVPCFRSGETLPPLVAQLHASLAGHADAYEVILVVDGSPDDTYAVARALELENPGTVRAILLRRNYGQHNAILAGMLRARYEITVTMDDDLQHRPDQIATLVSPLDDPLVDLVYGVSAKEEHGFMRSLSSRVVKAGLTLTGVPNAGVSSAFRAFRTDLREAFVDSADPFLSVDVILSWTTTAVTSVVVSMDQRVSGTSGYSFRSLLRHTWNMVTGYGTAPLRLVTWLGLASSMCGVVMLAAVLTMYFSGRIQVAGFTTLVSLLAILSGTIMLSIGILGEYLGRLHFRSMNRPVFLVRIDSPPSSGSSPVVESAHTQMASTTRQSHDRA